QGAPDRDPLSLPPGKEHSAVSNHGIETIRQFGNKVCKICSLYRAQQFCPGALPELPVCQVVGNRVVEQHDVLAYETDMRAEVIQRVLPHRSAIKEYLSA